jgi:hypothetical protein
MIGTARNPTAMTPTANKTPAASPASGFNASAASAAVAISVRPATCNVEAVDRMMKYMMMFENSIPMAMSHRD